MKTNLATEKTTRFAIGTRFETRGKFSRVCTVIDIHTTRNMAGELVRLRYVATHDFCGQTITDTDVCDATIARGLIGESVTS